MVQDKNLTARQVAGACWVQWTVDAKKLGSTNRQIVSPPLHVDLQEGAEPIILKAALYPKGMASFKKAGGVGYVQVKCCSVLPEASRFDATVSVGCGSRIEADGLRGPFAHDFASSSAFNLPKHQAEWHFGDLLDSSGLSLTVVVEIAPLACGRRV